ncbi:MAG: peptidase S41, partial [Paludibacter sp.]|nr:peptidase S41 [Paludibacter sp.]
LYVNRNRVQLKKDFPNFEKYNKTFEVSDQLISELKAAGEKEKIVFDETQFNTSIGLIKLQLRALIARDLWDMNEYYRIFDVENESLQKAVEILRTKGAYEKMLQL